MKDERLINATDVLALCLTRLSESVATPPEDQRDLAGIIKHFEIAFEQSYKCMLELLLAAGEIDSRRPVKAAFRAAFEFGWIRNEEGFLSMIRDRNSTSYTYDSEFAVEMVDRITGTYLPLFLELQKTLVSAGDLREP